VINKRYVERYINGKSTKSRKKFTDLYTYVVIPYSVETLKKLQELNLYFKVVDIFVVKHKQYSIELRIYKPKSYLLIAFLYNFFKEQHIDKFKILEHNNRRATYILIDSTTVNRDLAKGFIR